MSWERLKIAGSLCAGAASLLWAAMNAWHCAVERSEMQQAIQALADLAFGQ